MADPKPVVTGIHFDRDGDAITLTVGSDNYVRRFPLRHNVGRADPMSHICATLVVALEAAHRRIDALEEKLAVQPNGGDHG